MTDPAPERTADPRGVGGGLTGPVLWAGVAWLAVATFSLVPTAMLFAQGVFPMVGFIVGMALVGLPLFTLFELWHTRAVTAAVRSAMYSFGLAAVVLVMSTAGRRLEWTVAGIAALFVVPGALSVLAARQLHIEARARRAPRSDGQQDAEPVSPAEIGVIVLLLVAVLAGAFVLLEPTFSTSFGP